MKLSNIVASALLPLGLAACVTTTPPHNLSLADVRALNVQRVDIAIDPAARIIWPSLANEMVEARQPSGSTRMPDVAAGAEFAAAPPPAVEIKPAEYRAQALSRLTEKGRAVLQPSLKSKLAGTRPVVARMTVHHLYVPSIAGQIVIGALAGVGSPGTNSEMTLTVDFVDARTGAPVLSYPRTSLVTSGGHKINMGTTGLFSHDPIERMLTDLDGQLSPWLLKS
jgi:hypothetical protein